MMSAAPAPPASESQSSLKRDAGILLAGAVLAFVLCRHFFLLPEGRFFANHDNDGYALRLIEFRNVLASGYLFPQWCSHFRGGLGSPFFNFYQSGFFHAASLVPAALPVAWQLGIPLVLFAAWGFFCTFRLLRPACGSEPAFVAAVALLGAPYSQTNLYLRGDLSEFSAMMWLPACLLALNFWWNAPRIRSALAVGAAAAVVVCLHPAIGLITCGLTLLAVLAKTARDVSIRTFLSGAGGLLAAAGFSACYWLPLFAHMNLVSADQAWDGSVFGGHYHYAQHLNPLRSFLDTSRTETPIPIKLGMPAILGAVLTIVLQAARWKHSTPALRVRVAGLLSILGVGLFLMTPASLWFWDHLPLLHRIQFPWRILTVVSVALACLIGTALGHLSPPLLRRLSCGGALVVLGLPLLAIRFPELFPDRFPPTAAALTERFFAPDIANEWMPAGARVFAPGDVPREPAVVEGGADCVLSDFVLRQNLLTYSFSANGPSAVRLPHYAFPVGWTLTVHSHRSDVRPPSTTLDADTDGLMLVRLDAPFDGRITVQWRTTGMKRTGVALSVLTLLAALFLAWRAEHVRCTAREQLSAD